MTELTSFTQMKIKSTDQFEAEEMASLTNTKYNSIKLCCYSRSIMYSENSVMKTKSLFSSFRHKEKIT